ncbi:uncharacterized protein [Venturia canescens]|uniref:uncharacterized protein n=1 Tax=Venturia canescens TaxID=32260 RepID=UPI001C9D0825|nr:uncharacterized protein LOC122406784 [Venturia canescens]XP_043282005.1 uncharacterized protein LOC122414622 [Venturia canescens]
MLKSIRKDMIAEQIKTKKAPHVEPLVDLSTVRNNENVELVRGIVFKQSVLIKACGAVNLRRRLNYLIDNYWTAEEQKKLVLSNNKMTKRKGQIKIPEKIIKGLIDVCFTLQQTKEIPTDGFTSHEDGRKFLAAKLKGNRHNQKRKGNNHLKNQQQCEEPNVAEENFASDDDSASE